MSEALPQHVEFSVLVGIPAAVFADPFAAAFVLTQNGRTVDRTRPMLARARGAFGASLLVVFAIALDGTVTIAIVVAVASGLLVGVCTYLHGSQ